MAENENEEERILNQIGRLSLRERSVLEIEAIKLCQNPEWCKRNDVLPKNSEVLSFDYQDPVGRKAVLETYRKMYVHDHTGYR